MTTSISSKALCNYKKIYRKQKVETGEKRKIMNNLSTLNNYKIFLLLCLLLPNRQTEGKKIFIE